MLKRLPGTFDTHRLDVYAAGLLTAVAVFAVYGPSTADLFGVWFDDGNPTYNHGALLLAVAALLLFRNIRSGRVRLSPPPVALPLLATVTVGLGWCLAALVQVLLGEISVREIYDAVEWPIIVLLGAMLPVGQALEATGGTAIIAEPILSMAGSVPAWSVLAVLMLVAMLLSDIMNNAATAVLMAPIGVTIAEGMDVSVDPFLMAVAIACSSTYLTPIGHQSNLLVMGPGGYKFGDYWRMGLPLDFLILIVAVPLILHFWPL
jgi:di/tricarboxylate transporter